MNGNHETPVIAGAINKNVVVRNVKYEQWDEKEYPKKYYPLYPMGGFYIMSKSVINYVGANYLKLKEYVIEDAALGVWVDDWMENEQTKAGLGLNLTWVSHRPGIDLSGRHAGCSVGASALWKKLAIGHRLTPENLHSCHDKFYAMQTVEGFGMSPKQLANLKKDAE